MSGIRGVSPNMRSGVIGAGIIKAKMGNYQFDQSMASGTVSITGVGFQGNFIEGWVNYTASSSAILRSYGYAKIVGSTITQQCTQFVSDTSNSTLSGYFASSSDATSGVDTNMQKFSLTSFDLDGFTFANTKSGSPGSTHGFTYIIYYLGDML